MIGASSLLLVNVLHLDILPEIVELKVLIEWIVVQSKLVRPQFCKSQVHSGGVAVSALVAKLG